MIHSSAVILHHKKKNHSMINQRRSIPMRAGLQLNKSSSFQERSLIKILVRQRQLLGSSQITRNLQFRRHSFKFWPLSTPKRGLNKVSRRICSLKRLAYTIKQSLNQRTHFSRDRKFKDSNLNSRFQIPSEILD